MKKLISLLAAGMMLLGALTACGSSDNDSGSESVSAILDASEAYKSRSMDAAAKSLRNAMEAALTDADNRGGYDISKPIVIVSYGYTNCTDNELHNYLMKGVQNYYDAINKLDYVIVIEKGSCIYTAVSSIKDSKNVGIYSSENCPYTFSGNTVSEIAEDVKSKI